VSEARQRLGAALAVGELVATESVEARRVVVAFARDLFLEQRTASAANREGGRAAKRPPTWEECLTKSRQTRRRREVHDAGQVARHHNL
jgi:hypothetical protein